MIGSIDDVHRLINMGDGNRHIGETNMNEKSSRSHTIFRMVSTDACPAFPSNLICAIVF